MNGTVLVDTNVFTAPLRKGRPLEARYAKHTVGRVIVVAPQTHHNADLWIAAAALRWSIPLVAHDAVFIGCPGLDLRTELAR